MEPKLRDVLSAIQKLAMRLEKIEKQQADIIRQLSQVSKTVSPLQPTSPYQTSAPTPITIEGPAFQEPGLDMMKILEELAKQRDIGPEDHHCPVNPDGKHTLPSMWAGAGPIPCTKCGKNTGGIVR